jgi:hypothetical protein
MKENRFKSPPFSLVGRRIGGFFLILFLSFLVSGCNRPQATGIESDEISTAEEPVQISIVSEDPIVIELKKGEFKLTPVAEYKIAALVVGKETYSYGWNAKISPIDLALAWGKLADPESRKYVSYSVDNRWVSFRMKEGCPFNLAYVTSHVSNNHIIPSTRNLWYAVKTIKEKQKVILEGFLVRMSGTYDGKTVWWNTSLSRTDSGDGSCELIYVTKARIGNRIYE